ncbi:MAG: hypothetical protein SOW06_11075 [Succinivibrionaceae bacterium]|nr:hypothetical protein [Pseudomonadota bacterium]MDY3145894.1 hypothetical protein [Succinivibrionaceae bacterium]MDY6274802.1 hypothetical protein [Succinivibrionaceae bacterium]MDY6337149.1 hypothetical protein [Succinivibrionaceae bacterium]MDY6375047.1 hypothetical protein [Succinivibrionaceae bacterium]
MALPGAAPQVRRFPPASHLEPRFPDSFLQSSLTGQMSPSVP